jgi:hypothetical protein
MNGQIDQLVKSLLQKESLEQCTLQELQQFADRHPYFGAAQLLLTKKLQLEHSDLYDDQLQKTYLFFHNPLWVQQLLNDTGNAVITVVDKKENNEENVFPVAMPEPADIPVDPVPVEEKVEPVQQTPAPAEAIPSETLASELTFEPYHTVDYFASQGIKFKEEERPADKFGQQLRSFTDWLKTLKKLPLSEIAAKVEPSSERKVEQLAEHSLEEKDVVTETMAEVWEKQGNHLKAIEIYNKLSLLEPSKSAYFAAKIEELKKSN